MVPPSLDALYLIDKISQMPEPIRLDGEAMSGREFEAAALRSSEGVKGEAVVLSITGDPIQIPQVLGLLAGGARVFALPNFFRGEVADRLTGQFLAHASGFPDGSLASVSSGTSGTPKINIVEPYFMQPDMIEKMIDWGEKTMPALLIGRAFMTAPLQTTVLSYLAALALEVPLSMMTERPTADSLSAFVQADDLSIMTKGMVVSKLWSAGYQRKFGCFLSASAPLGEDSIEQAKVVFGNPEIVDVYSCTEAGILGARMASEPFFWMAPMVEGSGDRLVSEMTVGTIDGSGYQKKDFVDTGDVIEAHGDLIELIGRGKAKVSGFSVFPVEICNMLRARGYNVKSVYVEEGSLVCAHRGTIDEQALRLYLENDGLPSYSIPERFVSV
jgi:hypothetical protein